MSRFEELVVKLSELLELAPAETTVNIAELKNAILENLTADVPRTHVRCGGL
jgi:hypothetical protein